jgi:hypothetical protein
VHIRRAGEVAEEEEGWWLEDPKTVTTSDTGAYSGKVAYSGKAKNRPGKYRSVAPKVTLESVDICDKDASPVRNN